ncbi:hypothetical protein FZEAL_4580 [Fusarium zealandicum]|uniref:Uncharacterized protein n=1 Tax=Fusarium zealandicum TaxID=1053134 RepID=A0A8H4ULI2_9HYPO|nr:hypothetical protein FZEAL_4580 [Fusarium zealandicum]
MVNTYTITVKNQSGSLRTYSLFNRAPVVQGNVQGKVWSNVFASKSVPNGATVTFKVTNKYYAIVGSSDGQPGDQVEVSVVGDREVTLGSRHSGGQVVPGTSLEVIVADNTPMFSDNKLPNSSEDDAFEIRTGHFTNKEAEQGMPQPSILFFDTALIETTNKPRCIGKYMIGYGISSGAGLQGALASFCPAPNQSYQIKPVNTFYVNPSKLTPGSLIDVGLADTSAVVDFISLPDEVTIVHDSYDRLTVLSD